MKNYLYNGHGPFPALPERDETIYHYAVLVTRGEPVTSVSLFLSSEPMITKEATSLVSGYLVSEKPHYRSIYVLSENEWTLNTQDYVDTALSTGFYQVTTLMAGTKTKLLWSNHDVWLYDKSAVYLAASEPVPVLEIQIPKGVDRYSYIVGFNLALAGIAYPYSAPTPVAYLYNGIRLPALPEWDKANNPCAAIMRIEVDGVACALLAVAQYADSRFAIRSNDSGDPVVRVKVSGYYVGINSFNCIAMFYAPLSGGEWVATTESFSCNAEDLIWSNFDVADARTEDEAIFLAASTPVPVYE